MARAWGLHPDQLRDTDVATYRLMVDQLVAEQAQQQQPS